MKKHLLPLLAVLTSLSLGQAQTTSFTYQGRLTDNGASANGSYDLQFALRDALAAGNPVGGALVVAPVGVTNGLFTVTLDFGAGAFPGAGRWLEIGVRTNGSVGGYTLLSPRQAVTSTPYAIRAASAATAATATTAGSAAALSSPLPATSLSGTINDARLSTNVALLTGSPVFSGGVTAPSFAGDGSRLGGLWRLGGNSATTPGAHFLGTTDNQALEFKVNGLRALRLEPNASGAPNLIGGADVNFVAPGVVGVTLVGGAANYGGPYSNSVAANFGSIGGGLGNTIQAGALNAVIGGGGSHTIQTNADSSAIGGGDRHTILAGGRYGTIPGGYANAATNLAFAAGRQAKARHTGAFVWADSTVADFASTAPDQFLIRASGGVGVGKDNPVTALDVNGTITATAFAGSGASLTGLTASSLTAGTLPSAQLAGLYSAALTLDNPANSFTGDGSGLSGLWKLAGNSGTLAGAHFFGTTDNQPLEFKVNNQRALRLEPNTNGAPNVIGGASVNFVAPGVIGATIGGGGATNYYFGNTYSNRVAADFGTIGGGYDNTISTGANFGTIAGGSLNQLQDGAYGSTVVGGEGNWHFPGAYDCFIGGGYFNKILRNCLFGTIAGGNDNIIYASALGGSVGGGGGNYIAANSRYATIPGGSANVAAGTNSFAAGYGAAAMHSGAFVWSDSQGGFASTTNDQFNIRARGGVRLSDSTPALAFGTTTRQMLNLWGANYGIGVQGNALYHRSDSDFSWFRGGTHSDAQNDPGAGGVEAMRLTGGGLTVNGTFVNTSDRGAKEHFTPVNARAILAKVAALPLSQWNYKQDAATRHVGPMAQDFFAAFGVGPDDKHIATVDADGVALAAIQGLNQVVQEKDARISRLETELAELQALVKKLAEQVKGVAR